MSTWLLIGSLAVGNVVFKVIGPVLAGGREAPAALARVIALLAPALITALVVAGTFSQSRALVLDARAAGLLAGGVALWLRLPLFLVLMVAAVACAAVRLVT